MRMILWLIKQNLQILDLFFTFWEADFETRDKTMKTNQLLA